MSATTLTAKAAKKTTGNTPAPVETDRLDAELTASLARDLAAGDAALRSLQTRWRSLSAELDTTEADEDTDRVASAMNKVEREILALPCTSADVAHAKLLEVLKGLRVSPTGGEEGAVQQVIAWLNGGGTPAGPADCPIAALSGELDALLRVVVDGPTDEASAADELALGIEGRATALQATSTKGAVMQLAFAMHEAELVRGNPHVADRDRHHAAFEALMTSAFRVLAPHMSAELWSSYIGGDHPDTPASGRADDERRERALVATEWRTARGATHAAFAAHKLSGSDEDFDALCTAQEHWESLTPPSLDALAEVMGYSLVNFGPLDKAWNSADCPRSMRDLLDGGDPAEIIAARAYLHVLRMTGSPSPALLTPPIAGLFPAFDPMAIADEAPGDMERAWKAHHREADPYPARVAEFAMWRRPEFADVVTDRGAMHATWHYSAALRRHAETLIAAYEALGGDFNAVQQPDGSIWLGAKLTREGCSRSFEIEHLTTTHPHLKYAIAEIIRRRDGVLGQAVAS